MGLGETIIEQLATEFDGNNLDDALVMVGIAVTMWLVTRNIPNKLQALINGTSLALVAPSPQWPLVLLAQPLPFAEGFASGGINSMGGLAAAGHGAYNWLLNKVKESESKDAPSSASRRASMTGFAGQVAKKYRESWHCQYGPAFSEVKCALATGESKWAMR